MVFKTLAGCFHGIGGNDTRTSSRDIFAHDKPGNRRHTITDVWGISFVLSWVLSRGQSCASLGRGWATPRAARKQAQAVTVATGHLRASTAALRGALPPIRKKCHARRHGHRSGMAQSYKGFSLFFRTAARRPASDGGRGPASPGPGRECCSSWSTGSRG